MALSPDESRLEGSEERKSRDSILAVERRAGTAAIRCRDTSVPLRLAQNIDERARNSSPKSSSTRTCTRTRGSFALFLSSAGKKDPGGFEGILVERRSLTANRSLPLIVLLEVDTESSRMDATDATSPEPASGNDEGVVNSKNSNEDDEAPTVEETYEVTTTKRKTVRTSYKIQEVSSDARLPPSKNSLDVYRHC
ncbi:hypothetical protein KM043_010620 [Ampulex compressa]|nr:hypothetical protein KM043_010620 [Ampulex compressa]